MFDWVHYQFPSRVFFESEATDMIGSLVRELGQRVLLVVIQDEMHNPEELETIKSSLEQQTTGCIVYDDILSNPSNDELDTAAHFAKQCRADIIVAYGSRDSFNTAKAIALLCNNQVFALDLPFTSFPLKKPPLPVVVVPCIPSMGECSNPHFQVFNAETKSTFLVADERLFPELIFIDPNITTALSSSELTRSGIAILAASVESILSKRANDITDSISLRSIELITRNLVSLINDPRNKSARQNICMADVLCGMAHSNSRLGLCYSIANAISSLTALPFYTAMAILLPHVMEYNLVSLPGKYVQIARAFGENIQDITVIEAAIKAVEGVRRIYTDLKIPQRLSDFEVRKENLSEISKLALNMPQTKNTPRELDRNEIESILIAAY